MIITLKGIKGFIISLLYNISILVYHININFATFLII